MNIWFLSKYAVTPNLGNPTRQYFLSKYLSKFGYKVTLVFSRSTLIRNAPHRVSIPVEYSLDNFRQVMLDGPMINMGFSFIRIWSWIEFELRLLKWMISEKTKPDIIIVSSLSILTFLNGIWAKRIYGAKLIVEVRDIYPETLIVTRKFSRFNPLIVFLAFLERLSYKNANYIVSTLPYFDSYLTKVAPNEKYKFVYIPMGIDPHFYLKSKSIVKNDFKIPKNKFIVAYIGSFSKTQATKVVFDVIKMLELDSSIFFILAGVGEEKELGLLKIRGQENYLDLGQIEKESIPYYLSEADIALNPWLSLDLYKYGISPNKWMDYMYSSIPFIVCFNDEIEMLNKAGCASVIPSEDVLSLKNEILRFKNMNVINRKQMGFSGKKFLIENLTYENHAKTFSELFEKYGK
jgi:glycosyltransferase involved in cell wall biosynthesis